MKTFNVRIKELRKEKDLTMKQLGNQLGYSESTISFYESGRREPKTTQDLITIAKFFNVTVDYLIGNSDFRNFNEEMIYVIDKLKEMSK